jgi:hypothetical protein
MYNKANLGSIIPVLVVWDDISRFRFSRKDLSKCEQIFSFLVEICKKQLKINPSLVE